MKRNWKISASNRDKGKTAEEQARQWLEQNAGMVWLESNYRGRCGEIDLICCDPTLDQLVFIEVKSGNYQQFPDYFETINGKKRAKIAKVALEYIENLNREYQGYRFDALFVEKGEKHTFYHIRNAFYLA